MTKCRGCGLSNSPNDHTCKPTCRLCGKEHFTGDSRCKEIYRIPYTVKRRQWENYRQAEANILKAQEPAKQVTFQHTSLWDRHRSGSRQRQHRDRSSSFPSLESTTHRGWSRTPSRRRHGQPALIQQPRASSTPPRQPPGPPPSPPVQQEHQLPVIDWDSFRTHRKEQATPPAITDIKAWTAEIVKQVTDATQTVEVEDTVPHCDRYYPHLWERKKSLEALLATRKWDRDIRRRLARAHTNIENYAIELTRQSWHNICDQMNKTPNARNTWNLLRHLKDPAGGVLRVRQQLERIFHQYPGTPDELKQELIDTYIRPEPATSLPPYQGSANPGLDTPIAISEMHSEHHAERRVDRARPFEKRFSGRPDVTYTDASYHPWKPAMVAAALAPHPHESLSGYVQLHTLARDLSCRAECRIHRPDSPDTTISHNSLLTTYTDILQYYRLGRCIYPPAHPPATLIHMARTCTHYNTYNANTPESWESLLRTSEPADQRRLIQRAVEPAESQEIPADLL
ncbi:hypothetical protein HPB49_003980 [Dermacentor silvarum]|uniref:Uncharacterized protein n=1 Tax=Dermacentor silvarum TaxID=543639 RepID=A0ACB8CPJ6_DERSI|nr:hypothetical protein HPB49_003980 [Dermacentor silvarum]